MGSCNLAACRIYCRPLLRYEPASVNIVLWGWLCPQPTYLEAFHFETESGTPDETAGIGKISKILAQLLMEPGLIALASGAPFAALVDRGGA